MRVLRNRHSFYIAFLRKEDNFERYKNNAL